KESAKVKKSRKRLKKSSKCMHFELLLFIFHSLLFLFAYRLFRFLLEQVVLQQKIDYHQQNQAFLNLLEFLRNQLSRNLTHLRFFCPYIVIPFRVYYYMKIYLYINLKDTKYPKDNLLYVLTEKQKQ